MKITRTTTGNEPVVNTQIKDRFGIDYTEHDDMITTMIQSARRAIENYLGVSIPATTVTVKIDNYDTPFLLPYGPVLSFTKFEIDGVEADEPEDEYVRSGTSLDAVYTAGLEDYAVNEAIIQLVGIWYDQKEQSGAIPDSIKIMIEPLSRNLFI